MARVMNATPRSRKKAAWIKRHGFTNALWRLEERSKTAIANLKRRKKTTKAK